MFKKLIRYYFLIILLFVVERTLPHYFVLTMVVLWQMMIDFYHS